MSQRINTIVLGDIEPHLLDLLAIEGRATPRFTLLAPDTPSWRERGATLIELAPVAPHEPLREADMASVVRWAERMSRDPSLTDVASPVVVTVLRMLSECAVAVLLARAGCPITVVLSRVPVVDDDGRRAASAALATLQRQGAEIVVLNTPASAAPRTRAVPGPPLPPPLLAALRRERLSFHAAAFGDPDVVAAAAEVGPEEAAALQRGFLEAAMRFRADIWPGARPALDARLSQRALDLSEDARSVAGQTAPAELPTAAGRGVALMPARHGASGVVIRPPDPGEVVELVPTFDRKAGTIGVIPMHPSVARSLEPPPQPATVAPPRRPSSLARTLSAAFRRR